MSEAHLAITLLTLKVALVATLGMAPLGVALGLLLARRRFPGRAVVEAALLLPMILPPVAVGLALLAAVGPEGPLGAAWETLTGQRLVLSWQAAALASAVVAFPLLVMGAQQAFREVPRRLEQVALTMGLGRGAIFRRVTLPLAARGLAGAVLLAFARALGEFGATNLVAGSIPGRTETLALGIYSRVVNGHDAEAWTLAGISVALAAGALLVSQLLVRRQRAEQRP